MESRTTTSSDAAGPKLTVNPLFCDPGADVTFQSSDRVLFKIHSKHLASTSAGFAPPSESTYNGDDPVVLQENSRVLELLFQFIHPPMETRKFRHPSVMNLELPLFFDLAETAEKYVVFGAMTACISRIYMLCESNPIEVMNFAGKHDYDYLLDQAAPATLSKSVKDIVNGFKVPEKIMAWMLYYDHWVKIPRYVASQSGMCGKLDEVILAFLKSATVNPGHTHVTETNGNTMCGKSNCYNHINGNKKLKDAINAMVAEIPKFSQIWARNMAKEVDFSVEK